MTVSRFSVDPHWNLWRHVKPKNTYIFQYFKAYEESLRKVAIVDAKQVLNESAKQIEQYFRKKIKSLQVSIGLYFQLEWLILGSLYLTEGEIYSMLGFHVIHWRLSFEVKTYKGFHSWIIADNWHRRRPAMKENQALIIISCQENISRSFDWIILATNYLPWLDKLMHEWSVSVSWMIWNQ